MLGAGLGPAGFFAFGFSTNDAAATPAGAVFPDPATSASLTGRYIDASRGTYTFTADGRTQGSSTVWQMMVLALKTVRGTSAVKSMGIDLSRARVQGPSFQTQVVDAVRAACANMIRQKLVVILGVDFNTTVDNPDAASPTVRWRDLTTGRLGLPITLGP